MYISDMEHMMNKDIIAGNWKQLRGKVQQRWGKLTNDELDVIAGKKDVLVVDYVDSAVPVLAKMAAKRRSGYRALGYVME